MNMRMVVCFLILGACAHTQVQMHSQASEWTPGDGTTNDLSVAQQGMLWVYGDYLRFKGATAIRTVETTSNKGAANGYASLGADGKVPPAQLPASGGGATYLRISGADYTNSTTAYTDVTGLTLTVNAGTSNIDCDLIVSAAATTTGIQIALNGPSNSFLRYYSEYYTAATAKAVWSSTTYDPSNAGNGTLPVASAGTVLTAYKLQGQVVATGSGTLAVRGRSEIATSAVTIYRGSSCTVF